MEGMTQSEIKEHYEKGFVVYPYTKHKSEPDYKAKYLELLKRISKLQDEHITLLHENIKLLVDSQLKDKD